MPRFVIAVVLATLASPVALAQDAKGDACILNATETIRAPKKPREFTLRLDCGSAPNADQQSAAAVVASKANIADGIQHMIALGYELKTATSFNSFTGNAIYSYFTFVRAAGAPVIAEPAKEDPEELEDAADPLPEPAAPVP